MVAYMYFARFLLEVDWNILLAVELLLSFVVSLRTVLCLTGRYLSTNSFMAVSIWGSISSFHHVYISQLHTRFRNRIVRFLVCEVFGAPLRSLFLKIAGSWYEIGPQYSPGFPEYCCAWVAKRDYSPFEHKLKVHEPIFEEQIRIYNARTLWVFTKNPPNT